jgi:hypothetical protein
MRWDDPEDPGEERERAIIGWLSPVGTLAMPVLQKSAITGVGGRI